VVVRALIDDAICPSLEPNKPEPTVLAGQQGERHELAKVWRRRAARHVAVMLLDVEELEVEDWIDSLPLRAPPPPQAATAAATHRCCWRASWRG
jgi:hypothetical protein